MTFQDASRPMFSELFGPLIGLDDEWRQQGATEDEINMTAFDWDYVERIDCGGITGPFGGESVILEETDEHILRRDALGRTVKLIKGRATVALPLDFPVTDMASWEKLKPMFVFDEKRIDREQMEKAKASSNAIVRAHMPGAFDVLRELMGEEVACLAYYDQPELVADILATVQDTALRVLDFVSREVAIDQLSVHEDFAGRSGPLVGPEQIKQTFRGYYRAVWEMLQSRGAVIFNLDTDGNINSVMDALLDCGLTCMHPMEPAAGMDIVKLREQYGDHLAMQGGIDKFVLTKGRDAIRAELEYKLQPAMRTGGMVFSLDHRIPNGTPLEAYRYYVDTGREILGLPPRDPKHTGWGRMAF